jgi:molybdate transport system substrate-binding protein
MRKFIVFVFLPALLVAQCLPQLAVSAAAEKLTVAAGAGYKKMVTELSKAFAGAQGIEVDQIYGNMGQTIAQAKNSGLVDCVIGDKRFLESSGLEIAAMHEVGRGRLVAAFAKGVELKDPLDIVREDITRVSHPDPKKGIYGRAADEFLHNAGIYEEVEDKLLVVATVPQVSSYVLSKEVDVGFINLTDALGIEDRIGGTLPVDRKYYSPIVIVAGALASAPNSRALEAFAGFLATEEATKIVARHGL